jgi:hypothetical protein
MLIPLRSKNILLLERELKQIKNLRVVLEKFSSTHVPGKEVPADELSAISRPGATILADERRLLHKINGKFTAWDMNSDPVPAAGSARIFK